MKVALGHSDEVDSLEAVLELIGCTGDEVISSKLGLLEDSVLLEGIYSLKTRFAVGIGQNTSKYSQAVTFLAVRQTKAKLKAEPVLCFTIFDSLTTSGLEIISGLKNALDQPRSSKMRRTGFY
ncbi:MAG: hypothetical protein OEY59_13490 [Deltaproteobacteria bacterium]|nr:hypothetical protein [Deltaproteobacteria bacterium]